jgi:hypothetical protein
MKGRSLARCMSPCRLGALLLLAACTTGDHSSSQASLDQGADTAVTCTDVSVDCATRFIHRASDCAQRVNMPNELIAQSRRCAVENYEAALRHTPASNPDATRTKALAGLADALKQQRDNAADGVERNARQQDLDQVTKMLAHAPGGAPYAGYFAADSLVETTLDPALAQSDACARLCQAAAVLPAIADELQKEGAASPGNRQIGDLTLRVNRLHSATVDDLSQRSCSTCPTS